MDERVEPGKTEIGNVRRHIARYNLALALCDRKHVLDLSCGTGYGTKLISQVASSATGVDISKEAIDIAVINHDPDREDWHLYFVCKDAINFLDDWYTNMFDTLTCFETLEHFDDNYLKDFISKINKKIITGGHIIYSVPLDEEKGWNPHHKQVFTLETAREIFNLKFVDEFIQVGLNFYRMGENLPEGKRFYIGIRMV